MAVNWFYAYAQSQHQGPVDKAWLANAHCAESYATNTVASIAVETSSDGGCSITVTLVDSGTRAMAGKQFMWAMNAEGQWHFSSDLATGYLPRSLRSSTEP